MKYHSAKKERMKDMTKNHSNHALPWSVKLIWNESSCYNIFKPTCPGNNRRIGIQTNEKKMKYNHEQYDIVKPAPVTDYFICINMKHFLFW